LVEVTVSDLDENTVRALAVTSGRLKNIGVLESENVNNVLLVILSEWK
jgi:hypothetical protein